MKSKYEYLFCEKENFYNLYIVERKSSIEIAKIYNIKTSTVFYLLKKFDIKPRNNQEKSKYNLNHSYFEKIDTKEKAYWLGFLFADGYINNQNYVGISLIDSDISHLEKFRDAINSNHIIHTYNCNENCFSRKDGKYCRLIFKSVKMAKDLENLGCTNNKSLTLKFPSIEKCFYKDFIRGYFD